MTAEGEGLGAIARRVIDPNQFMTIGTADEEGIPWVPGVAQGVLPAVRSVREALAQHRRPASARFLLGGNDERTEAMPCPACSIPQYSCKDADR